MKNIRLFFNLNVTLLFLLQGWGQTALFSQNYSIDQSLTRKDFEAKVLKAKDEIWVVDFWASWCRPCIEEIPQLKELHKKFQGKPVRFVSISWDENKNAWETMLMRVQLPWQQILVTDMQNATFLTQNFPHKFIPAFFLVDKSGKVKKMSDLERLEHSLEKLLDKK